MLRSIALFLLLATASVVTSHDYTVMYSAYECEESVKTLIRTQIHASISEIGGRSFNKPVYGYDKITRKLRTGSSPRALQDCTTCEGCKLMACQIQKQFECADTCNPCTCDRRLEDDEPRRLNPSDDEGCGNWNEGNLTKTEMGDILTCEATKYIKEAMAERFAAANSCLPDIDEFTAIVTVL